MTAPTQTRKPTKAQARALLEAIAAAEHMGWQGAFVIARHDVLHRLSDAGWITGTGSRRVTDAGRIAVGRPDTIVLPDVAPGDLLNYRTHPDCVVRVTAVRDRGRLFDAEYVSVCADDATCPRRLAQGYVPRRVGETFAHPAYLLQRVESPTDLPSSR